MKIANYEFVVVEREVNGKKVKVTEKKIRDSAVKSGHGKKEQAPK